MHYKKKKKKVKEWIAVGSKVELRDIKFLPILYPYTSVFSAGKYMRTTWKCEQQV